jgi:pilus assembly protein CpaB
MQKLIPFFIAVAAFIGALFLMRPEERLPLVVAARDLPAGHALVAADLEVRQIPASLAPEAALRDPAGLHGQTLRVARTAGDYLYPDNLGGEDLQLAADERALAIHVSDSAGLAGLLKPGDRVGLTVTFAGQTMAAEEDRQRTGAYAKTLAGGLRVLYISPDFAALDPAESAPPAGESGGFAANGAVRQRKTDGVVVLAVPVDLQVIPYDFLSYGVASESRPVNLIDLLPALDQSRDVALSLALEPKQPRAFTTSGVFLPDLVVAPGPSPTPTETPETPLAVHTPAPSQPLP